MTARATKKMYKRCANTATVLKYYSGIVLIFSVAYHLFTDRNIIDKINKNGIINRGREISPFIYDNLDIIGFKEYDGSIEK